MTIQGEPGTIAAEVCRETLVRMEVRIKEKQMFQLCMKETMTAFLSLCKPVSF